MAVSFLLTKLSRSALYVLGVSRRGHSTPSEPLDPRFGHVGRIDDANRTVKRLAFLHAEASYLQDGRTEWLLRPTAFASYASANTAPIDFC